LNDAAIEIYLGSLFFKVFTNGDGNWNDSLIAFGLGHAANGFPAFQILVELQNGRLLRISAAKFLSAKNGGFRFVGEQGHASILVRQIWRLKAAPLQGVQVEVVAIP